MIEIRSSIKSGRDRLFSLGEEIRALGVRVPAKVDESNAVSVAKAAEDAASDHAEKAEGLEVSISSAIAEIDRIVRKAEEAAGEGGGS